MRYMFGILMFLGGVCLAGLVMFSVASVIPVLSECQVTNEADCAICREVGCDHYEGTCIHWEDVSDRF